MALRVCDGGALFRCVFSEQSITVFFSCLSRLRLTNFCGILATEKGVKLDQC